MEKRFWVQKSALLGVIFTGKLTPKLELNWFTHRGLILNPELIELNFFSLN